LWNFLDDYKKLLPSVIEDWDVLRVAGDSSSIPYGMTSDITSRIEILEANFEKAQKGEVETNIEDLWQTENKGSLRELLSLLYENADTYGLSSIDKEFSRRLQVQLPVWMDELKEARSLALKEKARAIQYRLVAAFVEAIDMIRRLGVRKGKTVL
jgi:hypothetical protein